MHADNIAEGIEHLYRVETDQDPATPYSTEFDFMSINFERSGRKGYRRNGADVWTPLNTTGKAYG